jgi:hypothetical protein
MGLLTLRKQFYFASERICVIMTCFPLPLGFDSISVVREFSLADTVRTLERLLLGPFQLHVPLPGSFLAHRNLVTFRFMVNT